VTIVTRLGPPLFVLLLASCASAPDPTDAAYDDDGVAGRIEIGTGLAAFEPITEDGTTQLELVHGPQGGYHVYVSMRVWGVAPSTFGWRVTRVSDGHVLASFMLAAGPTAFATVGDHLERVGERAIFDTTDPASALGPLRLEATVTDARGSSVTSVAMGVVVDREP
jgi:hypothetical protein